MSDQNKAPVYPAGKWPTVKSIVRASLSRQHIELTWPEYSAAARQCYSTENFSGGLTIRIKP